jgi:bifunctional non-homologous end joining protein LigD
MSLKEYVRKRDFKKTPEPEAKVGPAKGQNRFVIQKHAATRLHYDFRLELEGTLKSWAVPKGVPYVKGEKHLAVQVEDHPISYIDFEGTIPRGQYGGGTVMVWDQGTYEPLSAAPAKELAGGKLHFVLQGKKLKGEWYLVQLRGGKDWLLIRGKDDMRPVSKKMDDTSVLSGKTMEQLAAGDRVWHSNQSHGVADHAVKKKKKSVAAAPVAFVQPMAARLVDAPLPGQWLYEVKFDGFRALALKSGGGVRLLSRNEKDFGSKFPEVLDALARLDVQDVILDGEIVALDPAGKPAFQLLQARELGEARPPIIYYAFDLLQWDGKDYKREPIQTRKAALEKLLKNARGTIRLSETLNAEVSVLLEHARRLSVEGLIGKRVNSLYEAGQRSGSWIKLKFVQEQEMVIGGYTKPAGQRSYFGALLVGYYDKGQLKFASKVGTGFDQAVLKSLSTRLKKIEVPECPFVNVPEKSEGRYGQGITRAEMQRCHWVKPELVCQVKFSEWTNDGKMRHPVFLGIREDKAAKDVIREKAE